MDQNAMEAEKALCSLALRGKLTIWLMPNLLAFPAHVRIMTAHVNLRTRNESSDFVTITQELRQTKELAGAGGVEYLDELFNFMGGLVPTSEAQAGYWAIVSDAHLRRRAEIAGNRFLQEAKLGQKNPSELLEMVTTELGALDQQHRQKHTFTGEDLYALEEQDVKRRVVPEGEGPSFGLAKLDSETKPGMQPNDFWVVGARPRVGKSQFLGGVILHNLKQKRKVLQVSCEMGPIRNFWRLMAIDSGVGLWKIRNFKGLNEWDGERYLKSLVAFKVCKNYRMLYRAGITTSAILHEARAMQKEIGLDLITVDYFQLLQAEGKYKSLYEQKTELVRKLVEIPAKLGVPLLLGAQLNRGAESDDRKDRPSLAELKDTGALEEAASGVILLHRWDKYARDNYEGLVILAKNQDGPCGEAIVTWDREIPAWRD